MTKVRVPKTPGNGMVANIPEQNVMKVSTKRRSVLGDASKVHVTEGVRRWRGEGSNTMSRQGPKREWFRHNKLEIFSMKMLEEKIAATEMQKLEKEEQIRYFRGKFEELGTSASHVGDSVPKSGRYQRSGEARAHRVVAGKDC